MALLDSKEIKLANKKVKVIFFTIIYSKYVSYHPYELRKSQEKHTLFCMKERMLFILIKIFFIS